MGEFKYLRDTGRPIPSVIASVRFPETPSQEPALPPVSDETHNEEEIPMNNQTQQEQPEIVVRDDFKDPEQGVGATILSRIAALLSVKSLITIFLTVIFGMLVLRGSELPDQFISIYTMCISFFFGYQFKKAESKE